MSFYTYIINLKQDTHKYQRIKKRLSRIGINYSRFDAINGKNIKNKYDDLILYKSFIPRPVIGCSLSHYFVCKEHFAKHKDKIAMILEDDAVPLFKSKIDIDNVIKKAPKDWDIILLYTQGTTNYKKNTWKCGRLSGSTLAYLINYRGFKKRYDNYKVRYHTDWERWFSKCIIYKTPTMYFKPNFLSSSTSSKSKTYLIPFYKLINILYKNELESEITGFTGKMAVSYKMIRIPYFGFELDFLQIILIISLFVSIIIIINSKNKVKNSINAFLYSLSFFIFVILIIKLSILFIKQY